jgi:thiamine kinase-like enzyme
MIYHNLLNKIIADFAATQMIESEKVKNIKCTPLLGGLSAARNFVFDLHNKSYVIRLLPSSIEIESKMRQISITQNAASIGVGPKVHFVEFNFDAIVMDFILGRTVNFSDYENKENIKMIAGSIQKLHGTELEFPQATSPFERFRTFVIRAHNKKISLPKSFELAIDTMAKIENVFEIQKIPLVPCHLDLHPLNIMKSENQFLFIDWANGGRSNPYFDLATFAVFNCLSAEQDQLFLTYYFDRQPTQAEHHCFTIAQPVRLLVIAAAYLSLESTEESVFSESSLDLEDFIRLQIEGSLKLTYSQIGMIMLKSGLQKIQSAEFKTLLESLIE